MAFTTDPRAYVDLSQETVAVNVVNGWINGFTLSNDVGTPNTILDIGAGYAADSTNAKMINGTAFTKTTSGAWAAGTGNAGMGTGLTIANSTWYHVFAIINAGNYDVYFDTSATAANKPASTTAFRYIGSFKTDGSSHILAFTQIGQWFLWANPPSDLVGGTASISTLVVLSTPPGFSCFAQLNIILGGTLVAGDSLRVFSGIGGTYESFLVIAQISSSTIGNRVYASVVTDTSSQVSYAVTSVSGTATISTGGYINPRVASNF